MSHRKEWRFGYSGREVLAAAQAQVVHHRERQEWWTARREEAERDLRESGVDFRERAGSPSYSNVRIGVVIDPEKSERLAECREKVIHHREEADKYEMTARALERHADRDYELDLDDIQWFRL